MMLYSQISNSTSERTACDPEKNDLNAPKTLQDAIEEAFEYRCLAEYGAICGCPNGSMDVVKTVDNEHT